MLQQEAASKVRPQPVQFSFTLYDLDGHGKITKDDIAGIVSTIYESLGKSVVVPHYGSKTINVRLTVSPDSGTVKQHTQEKLAKKVATPRRRYRPRKLISDDEGSDTSHDLNHNNCLASPKQKLKAKHQASPLKSPLKEFSVQAPVATVAPISNTTATTTDTNLINLKTPTHSICLSQKDAFGVYDSVKATAETIICGECSNKKIYENFPVVESITAKQQQVLLQQREYRKKLLRKTRSRKQKVSLPL